MSFRPKMTAFTDGIRALEPLRWRAWEGVVADLWHAEGRLGGAGHYVSPDPRVVIFLGDGAQAIRLSDSPVEVTLRPAGQISYIPAGMPLWSQIVQARKFSHIDLHFDAEALAQRLGDRFGRTWAAAALARPVRLEGLHEIEQIAQLLAAELQGDGLPDLYGEGLVQAILGRVLAFDQSARAEPLRGGLTPHQMRRLTDFMQAHLHRRVSVAELAAQIGLSESWFARAFKRSKGETPHSWQQSLRITAAKAMLRRDAALVEIAAATGFADQAHMTRAFRGVTGTTPAAWRRGNVG